MARQEHDREDLLHDATAYVERLEVRLHKSTKSVFIGFRSDGAASIYFDQDPVYHFNAADQLRRAFVGGTLLKAEQGRLVAMTRRRAEGEVQLVSRQLDADETKAILAAMTEATDRVAASLHSGDFERIGEVPTGGNVSRRAERWLGRLPERVAVAASARAR